MIFEGTATFKGWSTITTSFLSLTKGGDNSEILNNTLGVDSFTSTRFTLIDQSEERTNEKGELTSNQHRLIVTFSQHIIVSIIRNGINVRRHFRLSFTLVASNNMIVIYWKPLVGIDCNTEKT